MKLFLVGNRRNYKQTMGLAGRFGVAFMALAVIANCFAPLAMATPGNLTWQQADTSGIVGDDLTWKSIASSSDGTKLVAVSGGMFEYGYIYTSTDSGVTWTQRASAGLRSWMSVASSADGKKLVAVDWEGEGYEGGYVYTSTDSGVTWHEQSASGARSWTSIASSADGTKLVAVVDYDYSSPQRVYVYTSDDSGFTWQGRVMGDGITRVERPTVASSADGRKLVAALGVFDKIYTSVDYGETWAERTVGGVGLKWNVAAISGDGTKLFIANESDSFIYVSLNSGETWSEAMGDVWRHDSGSIAISDDGTKLATTGRYSRVFTSSDAGSTWIEQTVTESESYYPYSVASSSDGKKLFVVDSGGRNYVGRIFLGSVQGAGTSTFDLTALPDASQTATTDAIKNATITTFSESCYTLDEPSIRSLASTGVTSPESNINILGGIAFNISCVTAGGSSDVELALGASYADISQLRAYKSSGATLSDISDQVTFTNREVNGVVRTVASYALTDGGDYDEDGEVNGTIVDPIYIGEVQGASSTGLTTNSALANTGNNIYIFIVITTTLFVGAFVLWRKGLKTPKRVLFK